MQILIMKLEVKSEVHSINLNFNGCHFAYYYLLENIII